MATYRLVPILAVVRRLLVCLLFTQATWTLALAQPAISVLKLQYSRDVVDLNLIKLSCFNLSRGQNSVNTIYFLNDSIIYDFKDPVPADTSAESLRVVPASDNIIRFVLGRSAEGEFRCGIRLDDINFIKSDTVKLVGKSGS